MAAAIYLDSRAISTLPFRKTSVALACSSGDRAYRISQLASRTVFGRVRSHCLNAPIRLSIATGKCRPISAIVRLRGELIMGVHHSGDLSMIFNAIGSRTGHPLSNIAVRIVSLRAISSRVKGFHLSIPLSGRRIRRQMRTFGGKCRL